MSKYVSEIINDLKNTSSRLEKEEILKTHKDNEALKITLKLALDDHKIFHIKKIPEYDDNKQGEIDLINSLKSLSLFLNKVVSGNKAIETLRMILENCINEERDVVEKVIKKDLSCGTNKATVNKVFGKNFVRTYPCMLASSYNEKNLSNITYPCLGQIKSDGMRINIIRDTNGNFQYKTRNGKLLETFGAWDVIFNDIPKHTVVDGEALVLGEGGVILDRKTGNGILNKIVKGTAIPEELNAVVFVVWDILRTNNFLEGKSTAPYSTRWAMLNKVFPQGGEVGNRCQVSKTWTVESKELGEELFQYSLMLGEEGIILKNLEGIWEDKRSKDQVKMKAEHDAELIVTGWTEGTGKLEGMLGSLTVETSDGKLKANVGSGLNEEQRKSFTEEYIMGKIVTVKYNEIIQDKKSDTKSLFLPIFVEVREDKTTANSLKELV